MAIIDKIRFRDVDQNEKREIERIHSRLGVFTSIAPKRPLTPTELDEQRRLQQILAELKGGDEVCEPVFVLVRDLFNASEEILGALLVNHQDGQLVDLDEEGIVKAALTLGMLMDTGILPPPVHVVAAKAAPAAAAAAAGGAAAAAGVANVPPRRGRGAARVIVAMTDAPEFETGTAAFYAAVGEAKGAHALAMRVLPILAIEGDPDGRGGAQPSVDAAEFARVIRALRKKGVTADEPQLRRRVNEVLDTIQFVGDNRPIVETSINMPELEETTAILATPTIVQQAGVHICSAMFEELKVYSVVDKLVELFQSGMLSIGPGEAGKMLYRYWKETPNRMSKSERRNFYSTTLGIPGGSAGNTMMNRDFNDLWLRFVSSVSNFVRQNEVDRLLRASLPSSVSHQQVRKSARDLVNNLQLHGYGMAYYAALEMQDQINFMISLLSDPQIKANYGAQDMWQVIDQVATLELGGAKTSSRYRTLATCGTIITAWLARNIGRIQQPTGAILDSEAIRFPTPRASGERATTSPTDYDLVNACELWLADTATSDDRIEEMSQPREAPVMTSKPVQIPAIAREMLEGVGGVGLGMGLGNGMARH